MKYSVICQIGLK